MELIKKYLHCDPVDPRNVKREMAEYFVPTITEDQVQAYADKAGVDKMVVLMALCEARGEMLAEILKSWGQLGMSCIDKDVN
jgi:hypothetical protein